jgi:hypothetical protein
MAQGLPFREILNCDSCVATSGVTQSFSQHSASNVGRKWETSMRVVLKFYYITDLKVWRGVAELNILAPPTRVHLIIGHHTWHCACVRRLMNYRGVMAG